MRRTLSRRPMASNQPLWAPSPFTRSPRARHLEHVPHVLPVIGSLAGPISKRVPVGVRLISEDMMFLIIAWGNVKLTTSPAVCLFRTMSQEIICRHEYVRIFQRRLKGLERRMVATRAYLPVGFKLGDFGHLGEGSYCFCTRCRARLYPRRTQAEKLASRQALAAAKIEEDLDLQDVLTPEVSQSEDTIADIHVEELEPESP